MKIERPADVEPALRKAFTKHKDDLVFMDFITDQTGQRVSDGCRRQGPVGNDPGRRTVSGEGMRHIISILIENEAGALSRVAGLFSARAYNIESLTVAPTEDPRCRA
jgi:hypothetical protein